MKLNGTVLVADDDPNILTLLGQVFAEMGFDCRTAGNGRECLALLEKGLPDVAFLDLAMPDVDGLSLLAKLRALDAELPVVIITAFGGFDSAVRAVHDGAYDFLTKPLDLHRLRIVARRAAEMRALSRRLAAERSATPGGARPRIVGRHPSMVEVFKLIGAASALGSTGTVLVTGETGTGKDLIARAIHASSATAARPFVTVQCAGMPETLIENELFGHERGAFTGAHARAPGRVETAQDGTLFLDEVGDLPPSMQVKLLRLLETGELERLGGRDTLRARCRFIAATHRDLAAAVRAGTFREDLFYRLRVVTIHVPPLRDRREDIPLLVDLFLEDLATKQARSLFLAPEAFHLISKHDYPGNVRELRHVLEHAATLARGPVILPEHLSIAADASPRSEPMPIASPRLDEARRHIVETFEKQFIEQALRDSGGSVTAAAHRAGVRRQHFQRLMQRYGIDSSAFRA